MAANVSNYIDQPVGGSTDNIYNFGGSVKTGAGQSLKKIYLTTTLADISTASTCYVVSPVAGTISKIYSIINGAIATADSVITGKIATTAITDGAFTIAYSGSAAGDIDSATPSAANTVAAGSNINFTTDGASSNTVSAEITIEITLS